MRIDEIFSASVFYLAADDRGYAHGREQNCRNARQPAFEHRRFLWVRAFYGNLVQSILLSFNKSVKKSLFALIIVP